jgi:hypothetical protein
MSKYHTYAMYQDYQENPQEFIFQFYLPFL